MGTLTFEILVEYSDTGGLSSIPIQTESLLKIFVAIPIFKLCLKNDEGEAESVNKLGG